MTGCLKHGSDRLFIYEWLVLNRTVTTIENHTNSRIKNFNVLIDFMSKFYENHPIIIIFDKNDQYYIDLVANSDVDF